MSYAAVPHKILRDATGTFHTGKSAKWTFNEWRFTVDHVSPDLGVAQLVPSLTRNAISSSTFRRSTIRNFNRKVGSSLLITEVKIVWSKLQVEKVLPSPPPSHCPCSQSPPCRLVCPVPMVTAIIPPLLKCQMIRILQ